MIALRISRSKPTPVVVLISIIISVLNVLQDYIEAGLRGGSFYLSESALFSLFWWMFIPIMLLQYRELVNRESRRYLRKLTLIVVAVAAHLVLFPSLVWILSGAFYDHTFNIGQTFRFVVSVHLYQLIVLYSAPVIMFSLINKKCRAPVQEMQAIDPVEEARGIEAVKEYARTIQVNHAGKHLAVPVAQIMFVSASSPYVTLHLPQRKLLHHLSLTALTALLDPLQFVRVHKSHIVNIEKVQSYQSRFNGDYDLRLTDGTLLRVSRNYAKGFKQAMAVSTASR